MCINTGLFAMEVSLSLGKVLFTNCNIACYISLSTISLSSRFDFCVSKNREILSNLTSQALCVNFYFENLLWVKHCKTLRCSLCRHQVLRIVPRNEAQLALIKDLEDIIEFEVIHHPLTMLWRKSSHINLNVIGFSSSCDVFSLSWTSGGVWLMCPLPSMSEFPLTPLSPPRFTWTLRSSSTPSWLKTCRYEILQKAEIQSDLDASWCPTQI